MRGGPLETEPAKTDCGRKGVGKAFGYVRVLVATGLLCLLLWLIPVGQVAGHAAAARPNLMALAVAIGFATICVSAIKLWLLLRVRGCRPTLLATLRAYYVGTFFNNFLPTSVGGDVVKVAELRSAGVEPSDGAPAVVVERASGVAVVMGLALAVALGAPGLFRQLGLGPARRPVAAIAGAALVMPVVLYALWLRGLKDWLKGRRESRLWGSLYSVVESFYVYKDRPAAVIAAVGLSAVFYALLAANIALVATAVGAPVGWQQAAGIVPLVKIPEMMPVSVGALGVREGAMSYCVARLGAEPARAAAVALILRLITWLNSAVGGLAYAVARRPPTHGAETASGGRDA